LGFETGWGGGTHRQVGRRQLIPRRGGIDDQPKTAAKMIKSLSALQSPKSPAGLERRIAAASAQNP
jgi:hypothetical protein